MSDILTKGPIGVFDSGYGGLTILREIRRLLPQYEYLYLGDNARTPYGSRSFDVVYQFTLEAVKHLFKMGCPLVILACNTASAKALRSIQQNDLPRIAPGRRVLGVIRPTVENLDKRSKSGHVGILATEGTVQSKSYCMEIEKSFPEMVVSQQACSMWVPLVENDESESPAADWFVKKYIDAIMERDPQIDTLVLACTHYPILYPKIRAYVPDNIEIVAQGELVASSLADYLKRHADIDAQLAKTGTVRYLSTESAEKFSRLASLFMGDHVEAETIYFQS